MEQSSLYEGHTSHPSFSQLLLHHTSGLVHHTFGLPKTLPWLFFDLLEMLALWGALYKMTEFQVK